MLTGRKYGNDDDSGDDGMAAAAAAPAVALPKWKII